MLEWNDGNNDYLDIWNCDFVQQCKIKGVLFFYTAIITVLAFYYPRTIDISTPLLNGNVGNNDVIDECQTSYIINHQRTFNNSEEK